jgi:hypothetical protein
MNCFAKDGAYPELIPEFIEDIKYISEKQTQREVVTLSFAALRDALTNFVKASIVRTQNGWEINGSKAVVATNQPLSFSTASMQWSKQKVHYSEVEGQAVAQIQGSK